MEKIKLIHQVTVVMHLFIPHDTIVDDGSERHQVPQLGSISECNYSQQLHAT